MSFPLHFNRILTFLNYPVGGWIKRGAGMLTKILSILFKPKATELHQAAKKGDPAVIKRLLDDGAKINAKDEYGFTSLHIAAYYGHIDTITALIASGADIDKARNK